MDTNIPESIVTDAHAALVALAHKQFRVTYGLMAVLAIAIGLMGFMMYRQNIEFQQQLTHAEDREQQFVETLKANDQKVQQLNQANAAEAKQQQVVVRVVHDRDVVAAKQTAAVTAPKPASAVATDAKDYLGVLPSMTPDGDLAFQPPAVQGFIATKIDRDRLANDLVDTQKINALEKSQNDRLNQENTLLQSDVKDCKGAVAAYKNVAKKSRWQRIEGAAVHAAEDVGIAVVSFEVGKHL